MRLLICAVFMAQLVGGEAEERLQIRLPAALEARQLAEVISEQIGMNLQYDPGRIAGTVRLALPREMSRIQLWEAVNKALLPAGFTTVVSGDPPEYRLVQLSDAVVHAEIMLRTRLAALVYKPGFASVLVELQHLSAESAIKSLAPLFGTQQTQIRAFGSEQRRAILSAPLQVIQQFDGILAIMDRPGVAPEVRPYRPTRTSPSAILAASTAVWAAANRAAARTAPVEFQLSPDGQQILIIGASEHVAEAEMTVDSLDRGEPSETRSYRAAHFGLDEVAGLVTQLLKDPRQPAMATEIIRDKLMNRLVIMATASQHARIESILEELDKTPAAERRRLRSIPIRHRPVDEMAKLLSAVLGGGGAADPAGARPTPPATAGEAAVATSGGADLGVKAEAATSTAQLAGASIATDPPTNRLIVMVEPQRLEQVMRVVEQLDVRQMQVGLEVLLVTLSSSQNRDVGLELIGQFKNGETTSTVGSLFGLSGGSGTARTLPAAANGLAALVVKPGDFAGILRALETATGGQSMIRASTVVVNNAKATINGVVQQPLTSINSGNTVSTTAVTGTTDAGTQITISPQITAGDQITLTYSIEQSAFIGSSTTTAEGAVIPPPKRSDSLASVASIPDGHIIALGGLSSRTLTTSDSRLPWIGAVPVLGWPFSSSSREQADSRFYVFIRAEVLRSASFADLRRMGAMRAAEMGVNDEWPRVEPQFTP